MTGGAPPTARPPHAYVPGRTARHPEGAFAALTAGLHPGLSVAQLRAAPAWAAGRAWLAQGFYWEAHELLEPVWMSLPPNSRERHLVAALIQIANARLKLEMGRAHAAVRICARARESLARAEVGGGPVMGLRPADLAAQVAATRDEAILLEKM